MPTVSNVLNPSTIATGNVLIGGTNGSVVGVAPGAISSFIPGIMTSAGSSTNPAFTAPSGITFSVVNQVFTSTGVYTATSGMVFCKITVVGGGGGGGGVNANTAASIQGGAPGGGGEWAVGIFTAAQIGVSQVTTIGIAGTAGSSTGTSGGNGGTTSVGVLITAAGGTGGYGGTTAFSKQATLGGAGGTGGSGGDYRMPGGVGQPTWGFYVSSSELFVISGESGPSYLGCGGAPTTAAYTSVRPSGVAGGQWGQGGGAGVQGNTANTSAGAAGTHGVIWIEEYVT